VGEEKKNTDKPGVHEKGTLFSCVKWFTSHLLIDWNIADNVTIREGKWR
jgi:hypothetical protein